MDLASWVTNIVAHTYNGIYSTAIGSAQLFPSTLLAGPAYKPSGNNSAYSNPTYTKLVDAMTSEPDANKRKQLYQQVNQILVDEAFVWPIATAPFRVVASAAVHDISFLLHDGISFTNIWVG